MQAKLKFKQPKIRATIQALRKFNRTCKDGKIKTLIIRKMIQINDYADVMGYSL